MLNIKGKCAIVLPDGQDLFSKTNKTLIYIREYLMKTCDLKEIIYLPSGIFNYTGIRTCILYFIKKIEGDDILKINKNKYKFSDIHQTKSVKFYNYNSNENIKTLLIEVLIEQIANNSYSLNYSEYIKEDEKYYKDDIVEKTLGDVCNIIKGCKKKSKDGKADGLYPLYYCSILGNLYLDTYDYIDEGIIINKTNGAGKAMIYYGCDKYNVGETTIHFKSNNIEIKTKYIYYYLLHNIATIEKYYKGANQKSITDEDLFKIKIPIPSIDKQNNIVEYLNFIYEKTNKTSYEKISELKQLNKYCIDMQKMLGQNEIKKF
jgi:hypothetical protein